VDDWIYRFGANGHSRHMRDEVVEFCAVANGLTQAVQRACDSRRPNGKVHNHQSRVKIGDRHLFSFRIMKSWVDDFEFENFDQLHDWLEAIKPPGIGPVTLYDVATRIGAYLRLEPTSVYLHANVRTGWAKLHGTRRVPEVHGRVPVQLLPTALQRIPPDQVEDMLCAYCEVLQPWLKK